MQSTGHTSTQAVSFVSIQGSVMMNGMLGESPSGCFKSRAHTGERWNGQNL
jgi:hypothetical protein